MKYDRGGGRLRKNGSLYIGIICCKRELISFGQIANAFTFINR